MNSTTMSYTAVDKPPSAAHPLPLGWKESFDDGRRRWYFYNPTTKESQWHHPGLPAEKRPVWIEKFDERYQRPYWYNRRTKQSSWTKPSDENLIVKQDSTSSILSGGSAGKRKNANREAEPADRNQLQQSSNQSSGELSSSLQFEMSPTKNGKEPNLRMTLRTQRKSSESNDSIASPVTSRPRLDERKKLAIKALTITHGSSGDERIDEKQVTTAALSPTMPPMSPYRKRPTDAAMRVELEKTHLASSFNTDRDKGYKDGGLYGKQRLVSMQRSSAEDIQVSRQSENRRHYSTKVPSNESLLEPTSPVEAPAVRVPVGAISQTEVVKTVSQSPAGRRNRTRGGGAFASMLNPSGNKNPHVILTSRPAFNVLYQRRMGSKSPQSNNSSSPPLVPTESIASDEIPVDVAQESDYLDETGTIGKEAFRDVADGPNDIEPIYDEQVSSEFLEEATVLIGIDRLNSPTGGSKSVESKDLSPFHENEHEIETFRGEAQETTWTTAQVDDQTYIVDAEAHNKRNSGSEANENADDAIEIDSVQLGGLAERDLNYEGQVLESAEFGQIGVQVLDRDPEMNVYDDESDNDRHDDVASGEPRSRALIESFSEIAEGNTTNILRESGYDGEGPIEMGDASVNVDVLVDRDHDVPSNVMDLPGSENRGTYTESGEDDVSDMRDAAEGLDPSFSHVASELDSIETSIDYPTEATIKETQKSDTNNSSTEASIHGIEATADHVEAEVEIDLPLTNDNGGEIPSANSVDDLSDRSRFDSVDLLQKQQSIRERMEALANRTRSQGSFKLSSSTGLTMTRNLAEEEKDKMQKSLVNDESFRRKRSPSRTDSYPDILSEADKEEILTGTQKEVYKTDGGVVSEPPEKKRPAPFAKGGSVSEMVARFSSTANGALPIQFIAPPPLSQVETDLKESMDEPSRLERRSSVKDLVAKYSRASSLENLLIRSGSLPDVPVIPPKDASLGRYSVPDLSVDPIDNGAHLTRAAIPRGVRREPSRRASNFSDTLL